MNELAKVLVTFGVILVGLGVIVAVIGKIPGLGRLPGDIVIKKGHFSFYFPLATCILVSILLSLFFSLFNRK